VHLLLGQSADQRLGYSSALTHFQAAWENTKDSSDERTVRIAKIVGMRLLDLYAMSGQLTAFDQLSSELSRNFPGKLDSLYSWGREYREWIKAYPQEAYKCALQTLDRLFRVIHGTNSPITMALYMRPGGMNGYTAEELVIFATRAGMPLRVGMLNQFADLPIGSVLHLRIEHFGLVQNRDGAFYEIFDPLQASTRWLTAAELAEEATGCILLPENIVANAPAFRGITAPEAAKYRGRCYHGTPWDTNDCGCPDCNGEGGEAHGGSSGGGGSGGSGPSRTPGGPGGPGGPGSPIAMFTIPTAALRRTIRIPGWSRFTLIITSSTTASFPVYRNRPLAVPNRSPGLTEMCAPTPTRGA
jgi:hypothetical protein